LTGNRKKLIVADMPSKAETSQNKPKKVPNRTKKTKLVSKPEAVAGFEPEIIINPETANKKPSKRRYSDWIWSCVWIITLTLLVLKFAVYQQVNVIGESMEPNYFTNEMLLVNTINKNIKRGQVTAVYEDKDAGKNANYLTRFSTKFYLKRIIGLPNEEIEIVGSTVIIYNTENPDGWVLKEDYVGQRAKLIEDQKRYYFPRTKIPANNYFVMGDNRSNSTDSRIRGTFPEYDIFGQETLKYWPLSKLELFQLPEYSKEPINDTLKALRDELKSREEKNTANIQLQ
jgi:signal peptidase I